MSSPVQSQDLLILLDFDRTIFDTHRYFNDLLEMVGETFGIEMLEATSAAGRQSKYFDPFDFLESRGVSYAVATAEFNKFMAAKYPGNTSGQYLFPDFAGLYNRLQKRPHTRIAIITTGTQQSQQFKLSLCPELDDLPQEILAGDKGERIQLELDAKGAFELDGATYTHCALVDDREDVLHHIKPAPGRHLFHIVRPNSKYDPLEPRADFIQISSLSEIIEKLPPAIIT